MRVCVFLIAVLGLGAGHWAWGETDYPLPFRIGTFDQPVHTRYTEADGLPSADVTRIGLGPDGAKAVETAAGPAVFRDDGWHPVDTPLAPPMGLAPHALAQLEAVAGGPVAVRALAAHREEIAVAADSGLYLGDGSAWSQALPRDGARRWAPVDVRAVAYTPSGTLWFAAPQGVGYREAPGAWRLFSGTDGLPFNDFTCMAAGSTGVWFGTTNGAILFRGGGFSFRQGGRWLLDNHVRDIAVDREGQAWIATARGVSRIWDKPMTLAEKAAFYEDQIELHHRRTRFGYVGPADLATPGDIGSGTPVFTDNDGHFTGLYLGAVSLGYGATGRPDLREKAHQAFRAVAFLSEVTQGGTHPAPPGFIARTIMPTDGPDPNADFDLAYDQRRNDRDTLWKIIQPRWPVDETGAWYWKNDSSSDELDGQFFGFAAYFDHVCKTEQEQAAVAEVVGRIVDHLLAHGYNLVDYDGTPTRWGRFSPDDLNRNPAWVIERGLNSYSILTYLAIAHHVTNDAKYREAYLELALDHGYGMNGMTQPKDIAGPGTYGQPDDYMAFMNYYHLIRYETDPKLLSMFYFAIRRHWLIEAYERNSFANFVYAACGYGRTRTDQWGPTDLTPPRASMEDAIDTLKRYPLDLIDWPMSNAHRTDLVLLGPHTGQAPGAAGHRVDGYVFPIDERHEVNWGRDPWALSYGGEGRQLRDGIHYLAAYYLGLAHGFIDG